jgi:membrane protein DedA with SNARE-associated domain
MINLETFGLFFVNNYTIFFLISMVVTALWGDVSLVALIVLSVHLKIPLWIIVSAAYFGTMIGDAIWFMLGKIFLNKFKSDKFNRGYRHVEKLMETFFWGSSFALLCIVKFLYGTRVITTLYLSKKKISFWRFVYYNCFATILWIIFMGGIGYLAAIGFDWVYSTVENLQIALTILVVGFILFNLGQKALNRWLDRKEEKIEALNKKDKRKSKKN